MHEQDSPTPRAEENPRGEASPQVGKAAAEDAQQESAPSFPSASQTLRGAITGQAPELSPEDQAHLQAAIRRRRILMILAAVVIIVLGFVAGRTLRGESEDAFSGGASLPAATVSVADVSGVGQEGASEAGHANVTPHSGVEERSAAL